MLLKNKSKQNRRGFRVLHESPKVGWASGIWNVNYDNINWDDTNEEKKDGYNREDTV